ncbi:hypothetical protein FRB90_011330 [Tulasnella sp. 427]|nr:hypothetical protein FRB90_011330 [Tulasnella sp. 427]
MAYMEGSKAGHPEIVHQKVDQIHLTNCEEPDSMSEAGKLLDEGFRHACSGLSEFYWPVYFDQHVLRLLDGRSPYLRRSKGIHLDPEFGSVVDKTVPSRADASELLYIAVIPPCVKEGEIVTEIDQVEAQRHPEYVQKKFAG